MPSFFDIHGDPTMDPYTILSLPPTATEAEIKKAYRMQMLQLHPDKLSPTLGDESIAAVTDKFHNVKDAYEFLVSPFHLTSRRLYMAKMASRRAEYERREAFLRRNGGMGDEYTAFARSGGGGVKCYRSGGGGAAGMAGTGLPANRSRRGGNNGSSPMPPSKKMYRSKSTPGFDKRDDGRNKQGGRDNRDHRGNDGGRNGGGNGMYKNAAHHGQQQQQQHPSKRKDNKGRERNGEYKNDSAGHTARTKPNSNNIREGRSQKPPNKSNTATTGKQNRQRTKSEPRRHRNKLDESDRSKKNKDRKSRDTATKNKSRGQSKQRRPKSPQSLDTPPKSKSRKQSKRQRAKSAPARSSKPKYDNNYPSPSSNRRDFFCPLTKRLMKDPVRDTEGNAYEREAIERWLRVQSSSPITNGYLSLEMLRPDRVLKKAIYKATGKPRSKSQTRTKSRSASPAQDYQTTSGRVLIDSYLREISSKSKLSVALDGMGICAFSYRRITFVIEVPITTHAGFMVYSSFDGEGADRLTLHGKMDSWNTWLANIGRHSSVSHVRAGQKTVFTLNGSESDMSGCDVFQKTLEYFVEMSLKLHNLLHPMKTKVVENVCLTRAPVVVA